MCPECAVTGALTVVFQLPLHGSVSVDGRPDVFCYSGALNPTTLFHLWDHLKLTLETSQRNLLSVHYGNSSRVVVEGFGSEHDSPSPLYLRPYELQCVGVEYEGHGSLQAVQYTLHAQLELWPVYPVLLAAGLTLLFAAPSLSKSVHTQLPPIRTFEMRSPLYYKGRFEMDSLQFESTCPTD